MAKIKINTNITVGGNEQLLSQIEQLESVLSQMDELKARLEERSYTVQISQSNGEIVVQVQ